ncbi:MAG: hypothetical protein ACYCU7_09870 [Acidimicrobiales bacterium]
MTLWTPSGEHPVGREPPAATPGRPAPGPGPTPADGSGRDREEPDREAAAATLEDLRNQLADAPPEVVVANHCYGLFELAAVYLSQVPPRIPQAQLAIDALGCLVDGLGERLGDAHPPLAEALAQVRLAYVQVTAAEQARVAAESGGDGNGAAGPSGG